MITDPRSTMGEMSRGSNIYMGGMSSAPGAGRPAAPATGGLQLDMEFLRRKMVENAAQSPNR